jgi:plastocyanin
MGTRVEVMIDMQGKIFATPPRLKRDWFDRAKSETRLASKLSAKLTAAHSLPAVAAIGLPVISAPAPEVEINNFAFSRERITVKAGATVTWTNDDDTPHTVASSSRIFRPKALDTKDSFFFTFTTPGVYGYFCSLHPHMTGTVVVEGTSDSGAAQ